jgi:hypothetical protein
MLKRMYVMSWMLMGILPLALVGCGETKAPEKMVAEKGHVDGDDHAAKEGGHPTEGPHHGHLVELGEEEYHAELVHDKVLKSVIIFLLDKDAKGQATSTDKEVILNLVVDGKPIQKKIAANPQGGEPEGESSRFITVDAELIETLEAEETSGRLTVTIGGKEYSGKIEHSKHEEHKE